ncbi:MAG TPA: hypothetical protein VGN37_20805 [Actinocatenispora sp.]
MTAYLDSTLRGLDAAPPTVTDGQRVRAAASLDRIVRTAPYAGSDRPAAVPPTRRYRRLALLSAAAVALVVGAVAVVQGQGHDDAAYASWTPTPHPVAGRELHAVQAACRDNLRGSSIGLDRARLMLAERRGDHVALLYRTGEPDLSGVCLARNRSGSTDVDDVDSAVGGSDGPAPTAPANGFTQGAISELGADAGVSITDGAVGSHVVGVTIRAGRFTVHASIRDGRYVAWWPGPAFPTGPAAANGKDDSAPILAYDLTLSDGTVVHDANPTRPR